MARPQGRGGGQAGPYSRFTEGQLDDFATWYVERMQGAMSAALA